MILHPRISYFTSLFRSGRMTCHNTCILTHRCPRNHATVRPEQCLTRVIRMEPLRIRIRPSKTANTLFTGTVLFPLTKEQTNNELLPQALAETHHLLVWNPCASEPGPSLKQVQHSSRYIFSETENYNNRGFSKEGDAFPVGVTL